MSVPRDELVSLPADEVDGTLDECAPNCDERARCPQVSGSGHHIAAAALRDAAEVIGHGENCRPNPDRAPYIGCRCRISLVHSRAADIEAKAGGVS